MSYTAGGYDDKGNIQGVSRDSINVIVSNFTPTGDAGVSQVNGGYALTQVDITQADKGTLAHELGHHFSGDTTGVLNSIMKYDPTGIVNQVSNAFFDIANDTGRALIPLNAMDPHIGRADPAGLRTDGFNAGARQFQTMLNQQAAIRPRQLFWLIKLACAVKGYFSSGMAGIRSAILHGGPIPTDPTVWGHPRWGWVASRYGVIALLTVAAWFISRQELKQWWVDIRHGRSTK